jgi:hypothetical protein
MPRRFPLPWSIVRTHGGWCVSDANGQPIAYTYGDDQPQGVGSRQMTMDEARRIAANTAKLPELLRTAKPMTNRAQLTIPRCC